MSGVEMMAEWIGKSHTTRQMESARQTDIGTWVGAYYDTHTTEDIRGHGASLDSAMKAAVLNAKARAK